MKKIPFFLLSVSLLAANLASCTTEPAVHSPVINIGQPYINSTAVEKIDTLFVGDTLQFNVLLNPYYNTITDFKVTLDRTYVKDSIFTQSDYEKYCDTSLSSKESGRYIFKGLAAGEMMILPLQFIGRQPRTPDTEKVNIMLSLRSDAELDTEFNPYNFEFYVQVVNKPASDDGQDETPDTEQE